MTAAPFLAPEPAGAPMTVVFDQRSNFAAVPNLLGNHPGASMLKSWLTQRLAPLAIRKRLKPGWRVIITNDSGLTGALVDNRDRDLITFKIIKGHRL